MARKCPARCGQRDAYLNTGEDAARARTRARTRARERPTLNVVLPTRTWAQMRRMKTKPVPAVKPVT